MKPNPSMDRRSFLRRVGLVAAATGLPPQFLLKPSIANAGALDAQATFLLLSVSSDGDPLNANLPGSYVPDAMNNPLLPATEVSVGSQRWLAGSPWADASLDRFRSRTCFFHHVCHTAAHTEMAAVLGLHGAIASSNGRGFEQLPSMIAQENAAALGTLQQEPIALGPERLTFGSRPLPSIRPQEVAALFLGSPAGGQAASLESLAELRDAAINDLYRREDFGAPQRAFLDRYAQSRNTARDIGLQIRAALTGLAAPGSDDANGPRDQILTALALFRLRLTPVVSIKVPLRWRQPFRQRPRLRGRADHRWRSPPRLPRRAAPQRPRPARCEGHLRQPQHLRPLALQLTGWAGPQRRSPRHDDQRPGRPRLRCRRRAATERRLLRAPHQ